MLVDSSGLATQLMLFSSPPVFELSNMSITLVSPPPAALRTPRSARWSLPSMSRRHGGSYRQTEVVVDVGERLRSMSTVMRIISAWGTGHARLPRLSQARSDVQLSMSPILHSSMTMFMIHVPPFAIAAAAAVAAAAALNASREVRRGRQTKHHRTLEYYY